MSSWALLPALSLHPKIRLTHTHTHTSQRGRYGGGNICLGCREGEETKRKRLIDAFEKQFKGVKICSLPQYIYKYSTTATTALETDYIYSEEVSLLILEVCCLWLLDLPLNHV